MRILPTRTIVLGLLAAIVIWFGATALVQPWTRPFTTALAVAGAVLFLLVRVSRFDVRAAPASPRPPSPRRKRFGVTLLGACVMLLGVVLVFPGWTSRADFDVVGILWIMQNIARIVMVLALAAGAVVGFAFWRHG